MVHIEKEMKVAPPNSQMKIRLSKDLKEQLKQQSALNQRSMNAQINFILYQFLNSIKEKNF
ncbi:TPA: hypothetical protein ACNIN5_001492 [Acinetobacter baumannii]|uniref:hypothetical protein n=1 Tax=Acinetobacter baumannii TaxID=470 RepID=UPI0004F541E5|nr:hypothetical protein [Acinetobacter baumannii]MDC4998560.1 hypothetical protein [Acinetobacter baumannii]MDC5307483.1 hypothetical protein [Acinetobacter baumannii]